MPELRAGTFGKKPTSKKAPRLSHEEQQHYKYAINVDGHVAAFRLSFLLASDCVVLQVASPKDYTLWYTSKMLKPWEHYVPVKADLSDLEEQIRWCRANDDKCKAISQKASKFAKEHFNKTAVTTYMRDVLEKVSQMAGLQGVAQAQGIAQGVAQGIAQAGSSKGFWKELNKRFWEYKKSRKIPTVKTLEISRAKPKSCPAILIPYRDRAEHLKKIRKHFKTFFGKNPYTIYVVEQAKGGKFNRGWLLNVAFELAKQSKTRHTHYIFHDVDSLPGKELLNYYLTVPTNKTVLHLASPEYYPKYSFYTFLGGVLSVNQETNLLVNGFPNRLRGWGGEDDCYMNRCAANNVTVLRPKTGSYTLLDHDLPTEQEINQLRKQDVLRDLEEWEKDGLGSLKFEVVKSDYVPVDCYTGPLVHQMVHVLLAPFGI
jgi:hypothetical protein